MDFRQDEELEQRIAFHSEGISFEFNEQETAVIEKWLDTTAELEGKVIAELNYIFCSDEHLYNMNVEYLQHDTYTDVITFPYSEPEDSFISGDIFISVERTTENASTFSVSAKHELFRVMVHGLLHLLGYEDDTKDKKSQMSLKEDKYLELLGKDLSF